MRDVQLVWTSSMRTRMMEGSSEKREIALALEPKRLTCLEELKNKGGPFTSAEEVDSFLADLNSTNEKDKKQRMKKEVQYARDTSTLLPQVDPLFKIQKAMPNGKSRDKTATEFGASMKLFLGMKMD